MKIFKVFAVLVFVYLGYKGFVAFKNFEIGASNQVAKIEEAAGIESEGEVIALLMFLGQPRTLVEHYYTDNKTFWTINYKNKNTCKNGRGNKYICRRNVRK